MNNIKFPKLISPYDMRDYKLAATVSTDETFPEEFTLPSVSVKNQGSVGSCVAHACSSIVEYHNKRQNNTNTVFSTEFIYGYRPFGYYVGEGMYPRQALKTLAKMGVCSEASLPGNHECEKAMENVESKLDELKDEAYPHRISTYIRIYTDAEIKYALMNYGYVLVSMPWHSDATLKNNIYTYSSDSIRGHHAVVIYGWNKKGWLVHNSWGYNWGNLGKFIVPFGFKWNEIWAITDNIMNENIVKPIEKFWVKLLTPLVNFFANLFRKQLK